VVFTIASCTNQDGNSREKIPTVEQLDPFSAPLYPANKIAQAKDFTVSLTDESSFTLSEQLGNVILINIWATWCLPCLDETPDLVSLYETYRDDGFLILGVSIDEQEESVVQPFIERFDISYPVYIDKEEIILSKYGPTMGIPTTYLIDRSGNLRYFAVGALTKKELEPRIKALLHE